jgi:hypothetical protein
VATYTNEDLAIPTVPAFDGNDPSNAVNFASATPSSVDLTTCDVRNWVDGDDSVVVSGVGQTAALEITGSEKADHITAGSGNDLSIIEFHRKETPSTAATAWTRWNSPPPSAPRPTPRWRTSRRSPRRGPRRA